MAKINQYLLKLNQYKLRWHDSFTVKIALKKIFYIMNTVFYKIICLNTQQWYIDCNAINQTKRTGREDTPSSKYTPTGKRNRPGLTTWRVKPKGERGGQKPRLRVELSA